MCARRCELDNDIRGHVVAEEAGDRRGVDNVPAGIRNVGAFKATRHGIYRVDCVDTRRVREIQIPQTARVTVVHNSTNARRWVVIACGCIVYGGLVRVSRPDVAGVLEYERPDRVVRPETGQQLRHSAARRRVLVRWEPRADRKDACMVRVLKRWGRVTLCAQDVASNASPHTHRVA